MLYVHKFTDNAPISTAGFWVGDHVCWNQTTGEILITNIGTENIRLAAEPGVNYPNVLNVFTTAKYYPLEGTLTDHVLDVSVHNGSEIGVSLDSSLSNAVLTLSLNIEP